ncbi:DJ-1/PfpI family protein [Fulvivirga ligni]|uniref:DJ-1/PfpI family protein n=1 Tax=Fulvivirga ligni TaxID=2904246 RepID=UPI001F1CD716|nr:DJ-1/PfpI family protein [Fulvivirga ligni]UII19870.1 DJ-1/PfpI family protein [Fulvivirga ligni]
MKYLSLVLLAALSIIGCQNNQKEEATASAPAKEEVKERKHIKPFKEGLPVIGLLMYDGVLTTEVTAAADVFSKPTEDGEQLFNVITIAESKDPIVTEEGLTMVADHDFSDCPQLDVLFVPSAYDMYTQVHNENIVQFIQKQNEHTKYTVSNCGGAQLIGKSGIAEGKKIVTWIGGGKQLQIDYPQLLVQDDSVVTYVEDGKFLSSNGNLASYISSLNLVEKMTSKEHREFVESYLYLDRLQDWK